MNPFCICPVLTYSLEVSFEVHKITVLVYFLLKSGLWVQKPFQSSLGCSLCGEGLCLFRLKEIHLKGLPGCRSQHTSHISPYFPTINKRHSKFYITSLSLFFFIINFYFYVMGEIAKERNCSPRADSDGSTESFVLSLYLHKASR